MLPERAPNLLSGKPRADRQAQVSRQESQPRPKAMVVAASSHVESCLLKSFRQCASDCSLRLPQEPKADVRGDLKAIELSSRSSRLRVARIRAYWSKLDCYR